MGYDIGMSGDKLKIFVSAYACEPGKGSEIGVGWHWVLEMSKYFELWVLTRANNQEPIEKYFNEHPDEENGIHWVYYDCPDYIKRFKHQMSGVRTYYTIWQRMSNRLVREVMCENDIPSFHLLTYGNAIWNISSYGQKQFFIWGPTGGVDTVPYEFSKHYAWKHRILEAVRRLVVSSLAINPFFYNKCKNADLILCKANSTMQMIPSKYRDKAILFTDVAMECAPAYFEPKAKAESDGLTYITVGRLDGWRGFDLLVEAFSVAKQKMPNVTMKIIGDGAEKEHLDALIKKKGLTDKVIMTGQISMAEYQKEMENCDVVLNACLKEGGVTNAFDCMKWGKPLLCIDTGGYTRNFDTECAIILDHASRDELVHNLADGMVKLQNQELRQKMSRAMVNKGQKITWEIKGQHIRDEILKAWEHRNVR